MEGAEECPSPPVRVWECGGTVCAWPGSDEREHPWRPLSQHAKSPLTLALIRRVPKHTSTCISNQEGPRSPDSSSPSLIALIAFRSFVSPRKSRSSNNTRHSGPPISHNEDRAVLVSFFLPFFWLVHGWACFDVALVLINPMECVL